MPWEPGTYKHDAQASELVRLPWTRLRVVLVFQLLLPRQVGLDRAVAIRLSFGRHPLRFPLECGPPSRPK